MEALSLLTRGELLEGRDYTLRKSLYSLQHSLGLVYGLSGKYSQIPRFSTFFFGSWWRWGGVFLDPRLGTVA